MPNPRSASQAVIDCDVHPMIGGGIRSLFPYLPLAWQKRFERKGAELSESGKILKFAHPTNESAVRRDAAPPGGGPGGSDPKFVITDYLERFRVHRALLNNLQISTLAAALAGPDESIVLCQAANDFLIEHWLGLDDRFLLAAAVPVQDPLAAAAEIRRIANQPAVAAVFVPLVAALMGNRYYFPIYEAAAESQLPIYIHPAGAEYTYQGAPSLLGGVSESYVERWSTLPVIAQANLTSLIATGVFARFPGLKVIFAEYGFTWLVPLMWRLDRAWRSLRYEVPWLENAPSAIIRDHIRLTTQPLEEPDDSALLDRLVFSMGPDVLLFSSDYPHWDNDMPNRILRSLPADARHALLFGNARDTLRMS